MNKKRRPTKEERIAKYLDATPGAISGSGGDMQTFKVACSLYHGWDLTEEETLAWLKVYNTKCEPQWSEKELKHKAAYATKVTHDKPRGHLLGDSPEAYQRPAPDWKLPSKSISSGRVVNQIDTTLTTANLEPNNPKANKEPISTTLTTDFPISSPIGTREKTCVIREEEIENNVVKVLEGTKGSLPPLIGQLRQLREAGAIRDTVDAEFYATLLVTFSATFSGRKGPKEPTGLTAEQLVPPPPDGLSHKERAAHYRADLEAVIGPELIDHDSPRGRPRRRTTTNQTQNHES